MIRQVAAGITLSVLLSLPSQLTANPRVWVRPQVRYYSGAPYRWYPPHEYWAPRFYFPAPVTGELKIKTEDKDARVYVDGGYLGIVRKLKTFELRPGNHAIELRDAGGDVLYKQRVAIVPGHTTVLNTPETAD
jgi:hypothetical protein